MARRDGVGHRNTSGKSVLGGFVQMPRRPTERRRKKSRSAGLLLIIIVVMLIAAFITRRLRAPNLVDYLLRPSPASQSDRRQPYAIGQRATNPRAVPSSRPTRVLPGQEAASGLNGENLTPQEHHALDEIIRERSK